MPTYERQAGAASQGALGAQSLSHVALCDPMDCSPPVSSVHGISHFPLQGIFLTQRSNPCLLHCTCKAHGAQTHMQTHTPASGGLGSPEEGDIHTTWRNLGKQTKRWPSRGEGET